MLSVQKVGPLFGRCKFCPREVTGSAPPASLKVFPLLLGHDDLEVGGDTTQKSDFALSVMPDAEASALIAEERAAIEAASTEEVKFDIVNDYRTRCTDWLESHFNDARLLYRGFDAGDHAGALPLLFALARHLAPAGALLELRVPEELPEEAHPWDESLCYDRVHNVVYTLDPNYFLPRFSSARKLLSRFPVVARQWAKDGGISRLVYAWLRYRKGLPLDIVKELQVLVGNGTDQIVTPEYLHPEWW